MGQSAAGSDIAASQHATAMHRASLILCKDFDTVIVRQIQFSRKWIEFARRRAVANKLRTSCAKVSDESLVTLSPAT
jgi:hypothetical protein